MVQTPQQRRANEKFASKEASKMGTFKAPKADRDTRKKMEMRDRFKNPPISRWWIYGLLLVLLGGGLLELVRLFFG